MQELQRPRLQGAVAIAIALWALAGEARAATPAIGDVPSAERRARPVRRLSRPACAKEPLSGRCLPDFLVVGAQKAGTSTLFELMRSHPQVLAPRRKELHFFFTHEGRSRCDPPWQRPTPDELRDYAEDGGFPDVATRANASGVTGEWSATYLPCWCCPMAVARVLPEARLIAQLRHPIARAHSRFTELFEATKAAEREGRPLPYYGWMVSKGFDVFAINEVPILRNCIRSNISFMKKLRCAGRSNVFGWSLYDMFLRHWFRYVEPGRVLVTFLEELAAAPHAVMRSIEAHLGVDEHDYGNRLFGVFNARGQYGWAEQRQSVDGERDVSDATCEKLGIHEAVCDMLYDLYQPHIAALKHMSTRGDISPLPAAWSEDFNV